MAHCTRAVASVTLTRQSRNQDVCTSSIKPCASKKVVLAKSSAFLGKQAPFKGAQMRKMKRNVAFAAVAKQSIRVEDGKVVFEEDGPKDEEEAALYEEFYSLLDEHTVIHKMGDMVTGTILSVNQNGAIVEVGGKSQAWCPVSESSLIKVSNATNVFEPNTEREFIVIKDNDPRGRVTLSVRRIELEQAWLHAQELAMQDKTVMGKIVLLNRGGVLVEVENMHGFVPASHLNLDIEDEDTLGQVIEMKFLEVDQERGRLVLSNRKAVAERELKQYKVGAVVEGVIQDVKHYGAFVDIGGVNGLLHISQISHERIADVSTVLTVGQKVKVMILSQDKERGRVSLSTRKLEPSPGDMVRNPQKVFDKADDMAATFRDRVAAAEAAAAEEERALSAPLTPL